MKCLICRQFETIDGLTAILFDHGKINLIVKSVPARVCLGCGESYVGESVAARLLQAAKKMSEAGILENVIEYDDLP